MSVDVNGSGSSFVSGRPAELFEPGIYGTAGPGHQGNFFPWAVSPDGQRFLMPQPVAGDKGTINVVLNWTSLLKQWPSCGRGRVWHMLAYDERPNGSPASRTAREGLP